MSAFGSRWAGTTTGATTDFAVAVAGAGAGAGAGVDAFVDTDLSEVSTLGLVLHAEIIRAVDTAIKRPDVFFIYLLCC